MIHSDLRLESSGSKFPSSPQGTKDNHISERSVEITRDSMVHVKEHFLKGGKSEGKSYTILSV